MNRSEPMMIDDSSLHDLVIYDTDTRRVVAIDAVAVEADVAEEWKEQLKAGLGGGYEVAVVPSGKYAVGEEVE